MKKVVSAIAVLLFFCGVIIFPKVLLAESPEQIRYKITIPTDYYHYAKFDHPKLMLHYGINGWQNIKDVTMEVKEIRDHGVATQMWYEAIVTVNGNDTIDYSIFHQPTIYSNGFWDNNDGKDYHVTVTQSNIEQIKYKITIPTDYYNYAKGGNPQLVLHYGINGWHNVKDIPMDVKEIRDHGVPTQMWYEAIVTVDKNDIINYSIFHEATIYKESYWDNNAGSNYWVQVIDSNF